MRRLDARQLLPRKKVIVPQPAATLKLYKLGRDYQAGGPSTEASQRPAHLPCGGSEQPGEL